MIDPARVKLDRSAMRAAREAKGVTQYDLAEALGVRMQSIWRWEHGQQRPLREQAEAVAKLLGVDLSALVTSDTERTTPQDGAGVQSPTEAA